MLLTLGRQDTPNREPVPPIAAARRIDIRAARAQAVRERAAAHRRRPPAPVRATIVEAALDIEASENRVKGGIKGRDSTTIGGIKIPKLPIDRRGALARLARGAIGRR